MRFSDVVTEAFNQPYPYEWDKDDFGDYHALAFLDDGSPLELSFTHDDSGQWHVAFDRNYTFNVSGEGDQQRVFATVIAAMKDFIKKRKPQQIVFSATKSVKPGQKSTSRASLYNSLINRYAAAWGYTAQIDDRGDQVVYTLSRIVKQPVAEGSNESKVAAMEKKLQDMQDRLELTRERRKMRGQRIQSTAEINLAAKMSELRQQIHQLKSNVTESASMSTHGTTSGGYTWRFEAGREVPFKTDVAANTFIRVTDTAGKTVAGVWADLAGDSLEVEYSQVFDEELRGRGLYTDLLKSLSDHYDITSDTDTNNAAAGIYRRLGADYDYGQARHTLRKQGVAEGRKKKKKKTSRYFGGYFFPGYGYYGSGESGEGGGEGESVAEGQQTMTPQELDEACWKGYHKEGMKTMFGKRYPNCVKNKKVAEESCPHCNGPMFSEELINEKKDACYYKVKSRYKVWPSAYASGALVQCRKRGVGNWGTKSEGAILEGIAQTNEDLRKWFKEKWVRFGPDGKIRGDCARGSDSEGKPKCLPQSKAQSLGKKGRASAAARKRRKDPDPERSGKAINVATKKHRGKTESVNSSLRESVNQPDLISAFRDFLPIAMRELAIEQLPPIRLLKQVPAGNQPTFGKFNNQENVIHLGIAERHPIDILRTLAHELVHYKQNTEHQLAAGSGKTGSPEENQAHEIAGVVMRDFNRLHPEYFDSQAVELTEDRNDYEIRNRAKLDNILVNLCRHVIEGQHVDPDRYGMVAACVVDPDNRQVIGVNELTADGTRRHGERVAMDRYQAQYGAIPEGSIIVTTCSPCNEEHMPERYGESCTDIINNSNCRKVYCGYQDPSQTDEHNEFTMEVTGNSDIVGLCEHFAATFLNENFADGKGPGRPGDSVRHGIPKNATMAELERASRAKGRKGQLARWQLNMRRGRKK